MSEVQNCVAYGFFRWALAYALKPVDNGPSRCHNGRADTVLSVGIAFPSSVVALQLLVEVAVDF